MKSVKHTFILFSQLSYTFGQRKCSFLMVHAVESVVRGWLLVFYHSTQFWVFPPTPTPGLQLWAMQLYHIRQWQCKARTNIEFFFQSSIHICTNLANSLLGECFSAEVILGMYLLIGPPHSRSNYRVWYKYREDQSYCYLEFFSLIFILLTNVCNTILSCFISNCLHSTILI